MIYTEKGSYFDDETGPPIAWTVDDCCSHVMPDAEVEAAAGAIGALFCTSVLYPLETAKTIIQAGKADPGDGATNVIVKVAQNEGVAALFKGISLKSLHVVIQNYLYFYMYEIIKSYRKGLGIKTSTLTNTISGVLAGCGNLTVTLPLDTLVVQIQTNKTGKSVSELIEGIIAKGASGIYRGFGVSCILTLNPALTFAVFDALKAKVTKILKTERLSVLQAFVIGSLAKAIATILTYPLIRAKAVMQRGGSAAAAAQQQQPAQTKNEKAAAALSAEGHEKLLADPLGLNNGDNGENGTNGHSCNGNGSNGTATTPNPPPPPAKALAVEPGMLQVLIDIVRNEGVEGLFRGCSAQIFTAVFKSGILLTTKEKIARFAMLLLMVLGRRKKLLK